jgi:hypothetical protein
MHEQEEHVAGDDPGLSQKLGLFDLTRNAFRVRVPYKGQNIYCEVYLHPDGTQEIHWMCPRCHGGGKGYMSRIPSARKAIEYDPRRMVEAGGCLNVEPFTCPWELGEDRRMEFGLGMCSLTLAIDNSVAKDA